MLEAISGAAGIVEDARRRMDTKDNLRSASGDVAAVLDAAVPVSQDASVSTQPGRSPEKPGLLQEQEETKSTEDRRQQQQQPQEKGQLEEQLEENGQQHAKTEEGRGAQGEGTSGGLPLPDKYTQAFLKALRPFDVRVCVKTNKKDGWDRYRAKLLTEETHVVTKYKDHHVEGDRIVPKGHVILREGTGETEHEYAMAMTTFVECYKAELKPGEWVPAIPAGIAALSVAPIGELLAPNANSGESVAMEPSWGGVQFVPVDAFLVVKQVAGITELYGCEREAAKPYELLYTTDSVSFMRDGVLTSGPKCM